MHGVASVWAMEGVFNILDVLNCIANKLEKQKKYQLQALSPPPPTVLMEVHDGKYHHWLVMGVF